MEKKLSPKEKPHNEARRSVLQEIITLMSGQMATHRPKAEVIKPKTEEQEAETCPHCEGKGCRFCE